MFAYCFNISCLHTISTPNSYYTERPTGMRSYAAIQHLYLLRMKSLSGTSMLIFCAYFFMKHSFPLLKMSMDVYGTMHGHAVPGNQIMVLTPNW